VIDPKRFAPADDPIQQGYVYGPELRRAIRVALATERPLLLRGSPGTGKTTMARDFARNLLGIAGQPPGADYYQEVVTSRTEARDLEWRFDTILRLAETQLEAKRARVELAENYVEPRALWWAFNPDTARARGAKPGKPAEHPADDPIAGGSSKDRPAVVLIDEIDKAEPEVANDLLEPFDVKTFRVAETGTPVTKQRDVVLVVTTNDERDLPAAFLRRCIVHELTRPEPPTLKKIARSHFGTELEDPGVARMIERVESLAAEAEAANLRQPGIAEFLDALHAIRVLAPQVMVEWDAERKKQEWDAITRLTMWKHPRTTNKGKDRGKKEA
jgi:MoxR-like ATPase